MPFEMIKNTVQVKANEETIQILKSIQTPKVKSSPLGGKLVLKNEESGSLIGMST